MEIYDMDTRNYNKEQNPIQAAIDTGSGSDAYGNHNAIERFARWCTNLVASHPIMPFRVRAILDPSKKSGRLL